MAKKTTSKLADEALLAGRYRYVRELGRGGTGRVLLALDTLEQDAERALKVVGAADAERLLWERELLGRVAHPAVARVFGLLRVERTTPAPFALSAGSVVLIEERAPGRPVGEVAAGLEGAARVEFALRVCASAARGLSALHALGFVHGDLKPQNLISPEDGRLAKLIDLGLARPFGFAPGVGGTLAYLAPEALHGERSVATDLYALGVCLLSLLEQAHDAPSASDVSSSSGAARWRPREDPRLRLERLRQLPEELSALLSALLSSDASLRPASARQLASRLAMALGEPAEVGAKASPQERAARLSVLPAVGIAEPVTELTRAIAQGGVVVLRGAPGSGRGRVLSQALTRLEREELERGGVGLDVQRVSALPSVTVPGRVVVIEGADELTAEEARAFVEASRLGSAPAAPGALVLLRRAALAGSDAEVEVRPLEESDFRQLVTSALEREPGAPTLRALREASAGLAGRLVSLMSEATRRGLSLRGVGELFTGPEESSELATLSPESRALAESLAVAGGRLESPPGSAEGMPALVAAGLASLDQGGLALRPDVCRHVYAQMSEEHRAARARDFSPGLEGQPAEAFLRACSGSPDEAERGLLGAIASLRQRGHSTRAALLAKQARRRLGGEREALRLAHADALRAQADYPGALSALEALASPAAALLRGHVLRLMGRADEARAAFESAHSAGGALRLGASLGLARLQLDAGSAAEAERMAAEVLERAGDEISDALAAEAWETTALARGARGALDEAVEAAERGLLHCRAPNLKRRRARLLSSLGSLRAAQGRPDEAYLRCREAVQLAREAGEAHEAASFGVNLGAQELSRGRPGPAREALLEGARRLRRIGRERDLARALYDLASVGLLTGDDALVRGCAERAVEVAERMGDADALTLSWVALAEAAARRGELSQASSCAGRARRASRAASPLARAVCVARAACLELPLGRHAQAHELLAQVDDEPASPLASFELSRARARVALAADDLPEAQDASNRASAFARRFGSFEARLGARLLEADVARASGQGAAEQAALGQARRLLDDMASSLDAASRARLRDVPAYQLAFAASPAGASSLDSRASRRFASTARELAAAERPEAIAHALLDGALGLCGAERGLYLRRGASGELEVRLSRGFGGVADEARAYSRSVVARALDLGQAVSSSSAPDAAFLGDAASVHQLSLRSLLAVPVLADGEAYGVLYLDDRLRPDAFGPALCQRVSDLAALAGLAFASLRRLAQERCLRARVERLEGRLARRVDVQAAELAQLKQLPPPAAGLIARSEPMRALMAQVRKLAPSDAPVLILGESGVGKELVARALHELGSRAGAPFISENCGAIPEALLETTLFGHVRGAFTGADRDHVGLFEAADGGTLLLDEVAEMSPAMQARLLRVLQEGEVRPVGADATRSVDVRLVCATHGDLRARVADGSFRQDLYYRLAVVSLEVPPLRERPEDLPGLICALLSRYAEGREVHVSPAALGLLCAHTWPGNVRELENELRRALLVTEGSILPEQLSASLRPELSAGAQLGELPLDLRSQVDALERRLIRAALERSEGNRTRAAEALGVSRYGLSKMRKRLELE